MKGRKGEVKMTSVGSGRGREVASLLNCLRQNRIRERRGEILCLLFS